MVSAFEVDLNILADYVTSAQLATQMYSTICYLSQRHPLAAPDPVPGDPYTLPPASRTLRPGPEDTEPSSPRALRPDSPTSFAASQRELAQDLVIKAAQIEELISVMPGINTKEEEQEAKIQELAGQLREMEGLKKARRREMKQLVEKLDHVVMGIACGGSYAANGGGV